MNMQNKTVLITGGGSGIGYEIAKLLSAANNKVIIIGRTAEKLEAAAAALTNVIAIPCDVTSEQEVRALVSRLEKDHADLSVLINNAGKAFKYLHGKEANAYEKAEQELETNYLSVIRLTEYLLPLLLEQPEAAIVNVSSIVGLSPAAILPSYSDSKAALHSYTQSLREVLETTSRIKVFELMPPTVNTAFSKEIGGEINGIPPADVALALLEGIEKGQPEIGVGVTIPFAENFFPLRREAFRKMNER